MKRRWWIILLALGLASAAALLWFWGGPGEPTVEHVLEMVSQLPGDTTLVVYADLEQLRASPLIQELLALAPVPTQNPEYAEFVRATGFDYERDMDRALLSVHQQTAEPGAVLLADGRFDREKISAYALRTGQRTQHGPREFFMVPVEGPTQYVLFTFLSRRRVALYSGSSRTFIEHPPANGALEEIKQRIVRVAGSPVFLVARAPGPPARRGVGPAEQLLARIRWLSLAVRPEEDRLHVVADAECDSPEDARQLAGAFDGLRLLARAALAEGVSARRLHPETASRLETVLRTAAASESGAIVRLHVVLTRQMLADMVKEAAAAAPAR